MARPKLDIDAKVVEAMASVGCPDSEIAAFFGCDSALICRRFAKVTSKARQTVKEKLRRTQIRVALGTPAVLDPDTQEILVPAVPPHPSMLIWLGKVILGQKETLAINLGDVTKMTDAELDAEAARLGLK